MLTRLTSNRGRDRCTSGATSPQRPEGSLARVQVPLARPLAWIVPNDVARDPGKPWWTSRHAYFLIAATAAGVAALLAAPGRKPPDFSGRWRSDDRGQVNLAQVDHGNPAEPAPGAPLAATEPATLAGICLAEDRDPLDQVSIVVLVNVQDEKTQANRIEIGSRTRTGKDGKFTINDLFQEPREQSDCLVCFLEPGRSPQAILVRQDRPRGSELTIRLPKLAHRNSQQDLDRLLEFICRKVHGPIRSLRMDAKGTVHLFIGLDQPGGELFELKKRSGSWTIEKQTLLY